jgi:hypothetical protein
MMTGYKLSSDTRTRLETMVRTNNGFEIADVDLQLRGPGDLTGTQQSGVMDLMIADLAKDGAILAAARESAQAISWKIPNSCCPSMPLSATMSTASGKRKTTGDGLADTPSFQVDSALAFRMVRVANF